MQNYIIGTDGKKRKAVEQLCQKCLKTFLVRPSWAHETKFCSKICAGLASRNRVKVICENCKKEFETTKSKLNNSKSGLYFCCRKCKDTAQRIGGVKAIMPPHYGTGNGNSPGSPDYYRTKFSKEELVCKRCNYNEFDCAVQIHHVDEDRTNNEKANLIPLCTNCHQALHHGKWKF